MSEVKKKEILLRYPSKLDKSKKSPRIILNTLITREILDHIFAHDDREVVVTLWSDYTLTVQREIDEKL